MSQAVLSILVMAAVTYLVRALPIAVFQKQITSQWLKSFLYYMPYAVLGAMTFPAILYCTDSMAAAAAGMATAVILAYLDRGLLTTALGAAIVVFLVQLF
jgi:branched-subunit amino acid transport protein